MIALLLACVALLWCAGLTVWAWRERHIIVPPASDIHAAIRAVAMRQPPPEGPITTGRALLRARLAARLSPDEAATLAKQETKDALKRAAKAARIAELRARS